MMRYLVIHHSALLTDKFPEQFEIINNGHRARNWGTKSKPVYAEKSSYGYYVQYHYFIEKDGKFRYGRSDGEIGWHSGNWKVKTIKSFKRTYCFVPRARS